MYSAADTPFYVFEVFGGKSSVNLQSKVAPIENYICPCRSCQKINTVTDFMQRARIIGPKNEKTASGAIFVRMCDIGLG